MEARDETSANSDSAKVLFGPFLGDDSGQDLIEYALILCFVALGAVASMKSIGTAIAAVVASIGATLTTAT